MIDAAALSDRIEAQFRLIAATRMAGIPVMNEGLSAAENGGVAMRGLTLLGAHHVGVLVTPWFMNLVFFPTEAPEVSPRIGAKADMALPSGSYEAIWNFEDALGGYWSCSLFSPMFEFADMEGAVATADAAMEELMQRPEGEAAQAEMCEAMVMPASPRGVEERLAEAERAEREARERAEAEAAARDQQASEEKRRLDRRALFGLSRSGEEAA